MSETADTDLLGTEAFIARLKAEGEKRYHDRHPFHVAMHAGELSREQIQAWVRNRFYYQTRIPIKDAIILSKSDDPAFRRVWIHRIHDHDGKHEGEGGLVQWLKLAHGVGLDVDEVKSLRGVLPGRRSSHRRLRRLSLPGLRADGRRGEHGSSVSRLRRPPGHRRGACARERRADGEAVPLPRPARSRGALSESRPAGPPLSPPPITSRPSSPAIAPRSSGPPPHRSRQRRAES